MGSKNTIAEWVVSHIPASECFVDLFFGGGAITHAAMETGRFSRFVINDIDASMPRLFLDAIAGKYRNEEHWICREEFFERCEKDAYVRTCWSFGNRGVTYMFAKEIEPWKKALWFARVHKDFSLLREFGIEGDSSRIDISRHADEYKAKYIKWFSAKFYNEHGDILAKIANVKVDIKKEEERLRAYLLDALKKSGLTQAEVGRRLGTQMTGHYFGKSQWQFPTFEEYEKMKAFMPLERAYGEVTNYRRLLERLQSLESLESLQSLESLESLQRLQRLQRLERLQSLQSLESPALRSRVSVFGADYRKVPIPDGAAVYCDPPYKGTAGYVSGAFDHDAFFEWARTREFPVLISEFSAPDDFVLIAEKRKPVRLAGSVGCSFSDAKTEKLFAHKRHAGAFIRDELF